MSKIRNGILPKGRPVYSREILRRSLIFLLVFGVVAPFNLLIHEASHCLTINAVGGECGGIYVSPGIKIIPLNEFGKDFGQEYNEAWTGAVALTAYAKPVPSQAAYGIVSLMGSGPVAVLSLLALIALYMFRPRGGMRTLLLAQSFMFLDLLTYTILPYWFGLPHFFVIGGRNPEPLNGAVQLGMSASVFIAIVLVFSFIMIAGLVRFIVRNR